MGSNTLDWCAGLFSVECLDLGNMALIKNGRPTKCRKFSHNCLAKTKQNKKIELQQLLPFIKTSALLPEELPVCLTYT